VMLTYAQLTDIITDRRFTELVGQTETNLLEAKASQCWASTHSTQVPYGCTTGSPLTIENVSIASPLRVLKYASALFGSPPVLKVINSAP